LQQSKLGDFSFTGKIDKRICSVFTLLKRTYRFAKIRQKRLQKVKKLVFKISTQENQLQISFLFKAPNRL
jgi:hypothetical protein